MTYTATYEGTDLGPVLIDLVGTIFAGFVTLGTPIALILLYRWLKGKNLGF